MCCVLWISYSLHSSSFFSNKFPLDSNWIPTKFQMNDWLVGCKFRFPPLTITHNFFGSFFALLSTPTGIYHRRSWGGEWGRVREWLLVARFFLSFLLTNQETETGSRLSVTPFAHRSAVFEMASRSSLSRRKIHCDTWSPLLNFTRSIITIVIKVSD